jgi:hypothetical protein
MNDMNIQLESLSKCCPWLSLGLWSARPHRALPPRIYNKPVLVNLPCVNQFFNLFMAGSFPMFLSWSVVCTNQC